jgi:NAD(P)H-nitrite reductase large subunit
MRHIIVGVSIAGLWAARKIKSVNPKDEIIALSKENVKPYGKMSLPYILSKEMMADSSYLNVPEGIKLLLNKEVIAVDTENKVVITNSDEKFRYDKLLISTGAHAYIPDMPGFNLPSVF